MKLQPNFSWQKYEGTQENQREQFQYQLQQQHILVANAVNATIGDESYWTRERPTAFTWLDGTQIWTRTVTGTLAGTSTNATAHGVSGINRVVRIHGTAQAAEPLSAFALDLPYLDPNTLANGLGLYMDSTNVYVNAGNNTWAGYLFSITFEYTKI